MPRPAFAPPTVLAAVAVIAATACGTGGGAETPPAAEATATAGAAPAAGASGPGGFCAAAIRMEALFDAGPAVDAQGNPTQQSIQQFSDQLQPLLDSMDAGAPTAVAAEVDTLTDAVRQAVGGNFDAVDAPAVVSADSTVDEYVFDQCELDARHEITAVDYAFEDVPQTVQAGQVGIRMHNEGSEVHEALVVRIGDDTDLGIGELLELPPEESTGLARLTGSFFAGPGGTGSGVLDLTPGRYGILCFLPVGSTSVEDLFSGAGAAAPGDEQPEPHTSRGMFTEFEVV